MSREPRIDDYIGRAPPFAQPILKHVRERVHAVVPEVEEAIKWSAPAFLVDGKILLIIATFKRHAAINFWRGQELRGQDATTGAMGQFGKVTSLADLPPDDVFDALIREAARLAGEGPSPRQAKHAPKPAPQIHPDFAAALDGSPQAKSTLDSFPPSARRDYLEWIADAKQDGTRQKRIATAIAWLSEGKRRNWKYENC